MSKSSQNLNDEINLIELFITLWKSKLTLLLFILFSALFGFLLVYFKDPVYESRIYITTDYVPPFHKKKPYSDFKKIFYIKLYFENWKSNKSKSFLKFEDLNNSYLIQNFKYLKKENLLARFDIEKGRNRPNKDILSISTNNPKIINEIFEYCLYLSNSLKESYIERGSKELTILHNESKLKPQVSNIDKILEVDRFLEVMEGDSDLLNISNPTEPIKVSPKSFLIFALCLFFGGTLGVFFVLMRKYLLQFKKLN